MTDNPRIRKIRAVSEPTEPQPMWAGDTPPTVSDQEPDNPPESGTEVPEAIDGSSIDDRLVVKSIKECGLNLPIGQLVKGKFMKGFHLDPRGLDYDHEKEIGQFRQRNDPLPNTRVVNKALTLLVNSVANVPLIPPDLTDPLQQETQAMMTVSNMFMADVYYMWIMARIDELGKDYKSPFKCFYPKCKKEGEINSDLFEMDVYCVTKPSILETEVDLEKGFRFRDGTIKKRVTLSALRWSAVEHPGMIAAGNDAILTKLHFIHQAITGVDGIDEPIILDESELGTLRKVDTNRLGNVVNNVNLGPSLTLIGKCPFCGAPFMWPLNWDYDDFFSMSSP